MDFGSNGSESRSMSILATAERNRVKFDAYDGQERVARETVLDALLKQAENHLAWLKGLEPGYYSDEYKAKAIVRARGAVTFFEELE